MTKLIAMSFWFMAGVAHAEIPFLSLERIGDASAVGVQTSFNLGSPRLALRVEGHGQWVKERSAFFASLSSSTLQIDGEYGPWLDTWSSLGNLQLGGWHAWSVGDSMEVVARGQVAIPLSYSPYDYDPSETAFVARPADITGTLPGLWARGTTTFRGRLGLFVYQADLGLEGGRPTEDAFYALDDGGNWLVHANAGVGVERDGYAASVELATTTTLFESSWRERHLGYQTLTFGGQLPAGSLRITGGLSFSLDAPYETSPQPVLTLGLTTSL
jgi:hypothetical protein